MMSRRNYTCRSAGAALLLCAVTALAQGPATVSPLEMSDPDFQALVDKTNLYVQALNSVATVRRSHDRYASWVDQKKGVTGKERYITYGLYELSKYSVADVAKAGQKGPQMRPRLPVLDDAATELATAVTALEPLVNRASKYYSQEDFRDDGAKLGQDLHLQMMPLFRKTFEAESALRDGLDAIKEQLDQRQLAEIERKEGRTYKWHLRRFMIAAKGVINLLPDSANAPVISAKEYKARVAQLEAAYDAFQAYSSEHPDEVKKVMLAGMLESAVSDFFAASKFLRRTLEAPRLDRREYVERVSELAKKYNWLIERTNSLR
ncbi:hypothetical protein BH20VER2_BH20VER2_00230 [soil metagenome]